MLLQHDRADLIDINKNNNVSELQTLTFLLTIELNRISVPLTGCTVVEGRVGRSGSIQVTVTVFFFFLGME